MSNTEVLERALLLPAQDRFVVVERLLESLDAPSPEIDAVWADEAERRLNAFREGRLDTIPAEEVFRR